MTQLIHSGMKQGAVFKNYRFIYLLSQFIQSPNEVTVFMSEWLNYWLHWFM